MGFFDSVKKAAAKTKLQGELVLMDRELSSLKSNLGSQLFPAFQQWETRHPDTEFAPYPVLSAIFKAANEDLMDLLEKKKQLVTQLDDHNDEEETTSSATSGAAGAKKWLSSTSTATKLRAQIVYYDREISVRTEIFGIQVFEELDLGKGEQETEAAAAAAAANYKIDDDDSEEMDPKMEDVLKILDGCRASVRDVLQRKAAKEQEILALKGGNAQHTSPELVVPVNDDSSSADMI